MKILMILTAALATAFVSGFFTAPTANAQGLCAEVSFCTVFTTSTFHQGNLNGLAGADAICNARAAEASLPGIYMAWLADQTGSPSTRFVQSTVPYVLTDGATVANSYIALVTDGTLLHAIDRDESGVPVSGGAEAGLINWTNVTPAGIALRTTQVGTCNSWTDNTDGGQTTSFGFNIASTTNWTDASDADCDGVGGGLHLYCFEQPQPPPPTIPTLSEWGLIVMAGILGFVGFMVIRRRKVTA